MAKILCPISVFSSMQYITVVSYFCSCIECWLMEAVVFPFISVLTHLQCLCFHSFSLSPFCSSWAAVSKSIPSESSVCITYFVWHSLLSWLGLAVSATPFIQWGISSAVKPSLSLGSKVCLSEGRARAFQVLHFRWGLILGIVFSMNE